MKRWLMAVVAAVMIGGGSAQGGEWSLADLLAHSGFASGGDWSTGDPTMSGERGDGKGDKDKDDRRGGSRRELSDEELAQAMDVLRQVDPEAASRLEPMLPERRAEVSEKLHERFPRIGWFLRLKDRDPEMYQLRIDDMRLSREQWVLGKQLREAKAAAEKSEPTAVDMDAVDEKLEQVLASHFDVKQKIRERELAGLEAQIERLREELEKRADERDEAIEKRKAELTDPDQKREW